LTLNDGRPIADQHFDNVERERYRLVASSKVHRLKPDAIDIRVDVDPVHWFLDDKDEQ
jgi:hypothetical protein